MLSETLDDTMAKAMKYENLTKASKFGSVYRNTRPDNGFENELLMLTKINEYTKKETERNAQDEEILKYIVDNPEETSSVLDFEDSIKTGLPFFRSVEAKLDKIFS